MSDVDWIWQGRPDGSGDAEYYAWHGGLRLLKVSLPSFEVATAIEEAIRRAERNAHAAGRSEAVGSMVEALRRMLRPSKTSYLEDLVTNPDGTRSVEPVATYAGNPT